jgi:hypothetical protein
MEEESREGAVPRVSTVPPRFIKGREEHLLHRLRNYLQVVESYDFIVTVMAVALAIYWTKAKIRQWRLEAVLRRIWEKRDREIRCRRIRKNTPQPTAEVDRI